MIVCGLVAALVIAVNISNIVATNKIKTTDYNGYLKDEQTKKVRKHLSINFALDIVAYAMAYALIIVSLTASVEGTKLLYEYYMIPILTVVSLITALRYLLYPKVYCAFRGAETYEVTGFSEVKLDEEKKQKKLAKKNGEAPAEKKAEKEPAEGKKEKPKKEKAPKKSKGKGDASDDNADTSANATEGGNA
jgi:glucan phosphoethanolaminetransferase (alkaline phosphatase superfamily)